MKSYFIISVMFRGLRYYYCTPTKENTASWRNNGEGAKRFSSKDEIQKEIKDNFAIFDKSDFVTIETILTIK